MRKGIFTLAMALALLLVSVGIKAQTAFYMSEGFENWTAGATAAVYTGWVKSDYDRGARTTPSINSYLWYVAVASPTSAAHGGTKYAYLCANYTYVTAARLKTPAYAIPRTGSYRLSFWLKNQDSSGTQGDFSVYYSLDGGINYLNNPITGLQHISTGSVWTQYDALLPAACNDTNVTLVFEGASGPSTTYYYYLDDIEIAAAPTCWAPTNLALSNLTGSSVQFNWDLITKYGVRPDLFSVTMKDAAGNVVYHNPAVAYDTTSITQQLPFTGLQGNTTYTVSVRSNCSASYAGYSDSLSVTFTTLTPAINPPLFQDFDTLTAATFPGTGYYIQNAMLNTSSTYSHSGSKSLKLTTSASGLAYIMFPLINLVADNFEVDLWIRRAAAETTAVGPISYKIGYLTDPSSIINLVPIKSGTLAGDASWRNIRFNSYDPNVPDNTSPVMIAITIDAGLATSVYIDDVDIHVKPACTRPENLTVSDVTTNSAVLAWDMSNATSFNVRAMAPDSTYVTATATSSPYTLTGLAPNTQYQFSVQGVCSATDLSDWAIAATAKTQCLVAATPIFSEDFSSWSANSVADCWNTGWFVKPSSNTLTTPFTMVSSSGNYHSASKGMSLAQQTNGSLSYLSTQALPIDSANKYMLSIWVKRVAAPGTKSNEGIQIWMTNAADDTTGGTMLGYIHREPSLAPVAAAGWCQYEYTIPVQGNKHVMIVGISESGAATYFDDVEVKLVPNCQKVSNIAINTIQTTSANVAWTPGQNETQWAVNYELKQGATTVADTTVITNAANHTINNLLPATAYTISGYVRAICGAGDTAEAVEFSTSFTTSCQALNSLPYTNDFESEPTGTTAAFATCWSRFNDATGTYTYYPYNISNATYARSGSNSLYFYTTTSTTYAAHQIAILPPVDTTVYSINTLRLRFWAKRSATTSYADAPMVIGVMSDPTDLATFVAVDTVVVNNTDHQKFIVNLDQYAGNGTYIAIRLDRQTKVCYCYLDDVTLEEIPNCADLNGDATVSEVAETSAKITLDDATAASSWSYAYGIAGTHVSAMTIVDTTVGTVVLNNLASATKYDLYVRRNCGNGNYGTWSEKISFTTTATPAEIPYVCGFEDAVENAKWMYVDGASVNVFTVGQASTGVYAGSSAMYVTNNRTTAAHTYTTTSSTKSFAYRTIHFDAKGYQIDMKVKATGGQTSCDFGRIFVTSTSEVLPSGGIGAAYASIVFPDAIAELDEDFVYGNCTLLNCSTYTSGNPDADGWVNISYYLDMTNRPGNYNLVLMWHDYSNGGNAAYPLAVDNISITELTCIPPSTINTSIASTSVGLSVNQPTASQWEFIVDSVAFTNDAVPANPKCRISSTDGTATATGLAPNTVYWYSVRTICGANDTSAWLEVESLRTFCAPYAVPYTEGFEDTGAANCWTLAPAQNDDAALARTTNSKRTGLASLTVTKATAVSPEFTVDSLTHYMINGWAYSTTDSATVSVGVMTDPNDATSFEPFTSVLIPAKNKWSEFTAYFTDLLDSELSGFRSAKHIALATGDNIVSFDDIMVDLTPTCPKPTEVLMTNITTNSFDISFTDNASANQWVVYVNDAPRIINTNPATISGLESHTNYEVKIAAICSATDTSFITECGTVTTLCDLVATPWICGFEPAEGYVGGTAHSATTNLTVNAENNCWNVLNNRPATATSGNPYAYVTTSTNYVHDGLQGVYMYSHLSYGNMYLVLPEFSDPANMLKVKYWYKNQNAGATYPQLKFGYFTNPDVDTSFVEVEAVTRSIAWTKKEIFTNNASYNIPANARLGFMLAKGTASGAAYLDDISVYLIRNCSDPEVPAVSNITVSTADVTITDTCAAHTAWEYVVVPSGFSINNATATAVAAKTFTITGLDDETNYDIYVRAVCGAGDVSNYIKASFRTLCTPFHVTAATPFVEDFNNYDYGQYIHSGTCYALLNEPSAASCWAKVYPTTTPSSTSSTLTCYGHTEDYLDRCLSWTLTASILTEGTVLRQFHLDGGATYEVTAWVRNGQMTTYQSQVTAMAGSSTTDLDTMAAVTCNGFVPRPPGPPGSGQSIVSLCSLYQEIQYYFTPDSTGDYFIGYKVRNSNGQTTTELYLDDWTITRFAGCTPVTPQVDSVTTTAAYISVDDTTAYQYEYVLNDSTAAHTTVASNRFVVGNLAPSSFYTLYFRRCCNASVRSEWTAIQFTTECGPITTYPYTEGFEGSFPPVCWSQFSYGSPANNWSAATGTVHSGTKAAYIPDRNAGAKTVLTTGEFMLNNPSGYYLRFWMYRYNDTYNTKEDEALHVGYKNAPITAANIATVNEVLVVNRHVLNYPAVEDPNAAYYMYEVEIPGGVSGSTWFSFDFHNQYGGGIYIDDITIEPIPTCVGPKAVPAVVSSTMTTATVTVNMNYKPKAEVTWALASTPDAIIGRDITLNGTVVAAGLTPSTMYAFKYRYICSEGDTSAWSSIGVGTTTATNCFAPQNLRTSGIVNDHHAEITWGGAPDAVAYQYELRRATSLVAAATTTADTLAFDSLMTNSRYTIKVRTFCADDTTAWMTLSFMTTNTTFDLPYVCGFEDATQNTGWHFNLLSLSGNNTFTIGTGVNNGGTKSLYVSNDGANYNYSVGTPTVSDAEVLLEIPAGNCYVSYDWQCYGEGTNTPYDYGRVFLVPASAAVSGTTYSAFNTSLPADAISLDNSHVLNTAASWNNYSNVIAIPTANVYKFVVLWANDGASGTQPPMAIDNIRVEEVACMPVASVNMISINSRDAQAVVVRHDAAVAVEYALSQHDNADSVAVWSVATSDSLSFTGLTPGNEYTLFVRHACDSATKSPAKKITFSTPVSAIILPFVATFEANDTLNGYWTMTSGAAANYFAMGSATSASGSRSIYVTNNGSANAYSGAASTSYAYIPVQFTAGMFDVSYKWNCAGESTYDYGHMFLAPASMIPEDNVILSGMAATALPAGAIALDADYTKLNLSTGWVDASAEVRIDNAGTYNLIMAWHNDDSNYNQPPLAIDDICIKELTCPKIKVANISFDAVSTDMFMMNVSGNNPGAAIIYHVASDASFTDTVAAGITAVGDSTITVTGLAASTWYYARLASLCGVGDTSAFTSVSIRTNCGINTMFPYDEDFESYASGSSNLNELTDNCWNVYAYSPSASLPYHYMTTTTSYVHGGSQALYIDNLNTLGTHQTFAMPKVDTLAGKQLSIWYKTYSSTAPNLAILEVGYLSNPNDLTTFNTLLYAPASPGEFAEAVVNYPANTPANARPAFKATGSYYLYVDDIHMNKVVTGHTYYDTICFGQGYTGHGFTCTAGTLAAGDNLLSHVVRATAAGVADSVVSLNIYVRPELNTVFSDTICPGVPYTKGLFNITNPTTRNYFTTFTSVNGCDSTVSLNLYVIPATENIFDTICNGDSYQFGTQTLTQAGTYYDTVPSGQGCNIVRVLNLHVVATETHQYEQVCSGASFSWEGQNYSQAGTYTKVVPGVAGCSLTKYLHLAVTPTDSTITVSFCQGGSVQIVDTIINTAGSYSFVRLNQATGCNTTYHVTATEITPTPEYVSDQACEGKPYYGYGEAGIIITKDTTITQYTRTADGKCDSVVIATVKLNPTTYGKTEYVEIAAGETYTWHDNTYTTSGVYYFDTTNVNGCDSICKLNLTVGDVPPVAVDDVVMLNISLIPNPVNAGETSFIYGNFTNVKSVEVLNSFGQVIDTFVPSGYPIEVQSINASGIYYVRVVTEDDKVAVEKLIVE